MKTHHRLASSFFLLHLAACNRPPPCTDCDGEDIAVEDNEVEGVASDLPCGGADLKNDDRNCGACGNECEVMWPDTKYAAGGCVDGECGRTWTALGPLPAPPATRTCEEYCALGNIPCVPRGCSGMTAFVCANLGDFGEQCNLGDPLNSAITEMTGACDEIIPYPEIDDSEGFVFVNYACCCGP